MLPTRLPIGMVSIYGVNSSDVFGQNMQFGTITDKYGGASSVSLGSSVMFNPADSQQVVYGDITFYILPENKLSLIEAAPL